MRKQEPMARLLAHYRRHSTLLGELLAIIHGDGGHHQLSEGTDKAVQDAIWKVHAAFFMCETVQWPREAVERMAVIMQEGGDIAEALKIAGRVP